jgi:two-component system chemotaxis response regulator CheB
VNERPLQVLVVDDSAVVRQTLSSVLGQAPGIEVAVAADPLIAMDKMRAKRPDVILLDLEMPRMDGVTFLRRLMREDPLPVVVCSGLAERGTEAALRAVEEGAVEVIAKPRLGVRDFLEESAVLLVDAVRAAALARAGRGRWRPGRAEPTRGAAPAARSRPAARATTAHVVAIGASTGGTEALRAILERLPPDVPGVVVVQHMPEVFTRTFAERLDRLCDLDVAEARDGDELRVGRVLIAPGNRHASVVRDGARYVVEVRDGPLVSRHRPSVDVLFRSVARAAGRDAVGVILTGMGDDGAEGMVELKRAGAATIAQDERSCAVFGMPREAIDRHAVDEVVSLLQIPAAILRRLGTRSTGPA